MVEEIRDEEPTGESDANVRDTQEEEVVLEELTDEQPDESTNVEEEPVEEVVEVEKAEVKEEIEYFEEHGTLGEYTHLNLNEKK